jgi:hypothetical protein
MRVLLEHKGKAVEVIELSITENGDLCITYRIIGHGSMQAKGKDATEIFDRLKKQLDNLK